MNFLYAAGSKNSLRTLGEGGLRNPRWGEIGHSGRIKEITLKYIGNIHFSGISLTKDRIIAADDDKGGIAFLALPPFFLNR